MFTEEALERLVSGFEDCTLPRSEWTHSAHLAVALGYVRLYGPDEALRKMRDGVRRYNAASGGDPNGYHETITVAWIRLIAVFVAQRDPGAPRGVLAAQLLAEYGDKDYLFRYYTRDTLLSSAARARWVEPDLAPLPEDMRGDGA